ncbi:unnamed protein product [Prunus armeniaca]
MSSLALGRTGLWKYLCVMPVLEEGVVLPLNPPILSSGQFQSWSAAYSNRMPSVFYDSCHRRGLILAVQSYFQLTFTFALAAQHYPSRDGCLWPLISFSCDSSACTGATLCC